MLKVVLADDHAIIRYGLKQIILEEYPDAHVHEAQNSNEVFKIVRDEALDLIILDITMPSRDGIEVLKDLKKSKPKLPVLILSMHSEERFAVRALKSGAAGYLTKTSAPDELGQAIKKILKGGKYITPSLAELLADSFEQGEAESAANILSDREYQVFLLIASGKSVSECAEEISLSVNTISTYRARILEKLKLKTNADLTRYAINHGLID
jgi:two-component system, NarL family, invasion response regulator UvrY